MRVWIPIALPAALLIAYARVGLRPLRSPHEAVPSTVEARSFWIEHVQDGPARVRHKWGASWPLDAYDGQSGRLWIARPPSLGHAFLVFDHEWGRSTIRRVVWRMEGLFGLTRVAELDTWDDFLWDKDDEASSRSVFQDVDGDGLEEVSSTARVWLKDDDEGWGHRTVFHAWTGEGFEPKWARLFFGTYGPLLAVDDPRSKVW